jgi:hypothetical protein
MEETRFDEMATTLAISRSRRGALYLLMGSAVALLGTDAQAASDRRRKTRQQPRCVPAGKTIRRKQGRRCCELLGVESPTKGFCCRPNGSGCSSDSQCCLGVCSAGVCQNTTVQPPLPPVVRVGDTYSGCVAYGQACTTAADCCLLRDGSPIPCTGGLCRFP